MGFNGDLKGLWADLTDGQLVSAMSHRILNPDADYLLQRWAQSLVDHFDTLEEGCFVMIRSDPPLGWMN